MLTGLVFNIQRYSLHDGPGIRTTVFLKGCPLRCWWCHNPESQSAESEISYLAGRCSDCGRCRTVCPRADEWGEERLPRQKDQCTGCAACVAVCPSQARQVVGRRMRVAEVIAEVLKDRIFFDDSGGGVTFSGGEPLLQRPFLEEVLLSCRQQEIHTAVDTCGSAAEQDLLAIAPLVDLFLYDIKVMDDARHRELTGVGNTQILANLRALGRVHDNIALRVPVIPGYNDDPENLASTARLAASVPGVRRVHLLPFHATGLHKWTGLGRPRALPVVTPPSVGLLEEAASPFRACGIQVETGG